MEHRFASAAQFKVTRKPGGHPSLTRTRLLRTTAWAVVGILVASSLAGCGKKDAAAPPAAVEALALPLTTAPESVAAPAPAAAALPPAPRIRIVRVANRADNYAYVDRAYAMNSAIGQAPPDYGFDYRDTHPWVWRSANRSVRLVEPVRGGYREYYYQPGADEPYLVRDPQYSYGYSNGQLVTVYDNDGRLLPDDYVDRRADDAGRYLARAVALYEASLQNERRSVNAANWSERRAELDAARAQWEEQQSRQDAWRAYHAQHQAEEQSYWQAEHEQRDQSARSFSDWSRRGYDGPPPPVSYGNRDARGDQPGPSYARQPQNNGGAAGGLIGGILGSVTGQRARDGAPPAQSAPGNAQQSQAAADSATRAEQQRVQADAARAQQQAQAEAARKVQAEADAAKQAQAKAAADAATLAQRQKAQVDAARAQQQAQAEAARKAEADAAKQAQAKSAADAALAQQQKAQADAARSQQLAQAEAARKAQAEAVAAKQSQAKAAADGLAQQQKARTDAERAQQQAQTNRPPIPAPQAAPAGAQKDNASEDARRAALKKDRKHTETGDAAPEKTPAQ